MNSWDQTDVEFRVGVEGEVCEAHRLILGHRSPVFKALLSHAGGAQSE